MNTPSNPEFVGVVVDESENPYRSCVQGLANEPITVRALLRRAESLLAGEPGFVGFGDYSKKAIVERLVANRPRIAIVQGSLDHPAHLHDHEHMLRAAARVWYNGGVPFTFGLPVICDGTAQSNIGQCYSLSSRNFTAAAVNINFEGHAYHSAYVIAGCDKSPSGILSGLAAADRARRTEGRGTAPVWAVFSPSHVLKGGSIPPETRSRLREIEAAARAAGDAQLADDLAKNCRYILQCASDEAFLGLLDRARELGLVEAAEAGRLLEELAEATCDEQGGICAFNGSGNSSRTLISALGFVPPNAELLVEAPGSELVAENVDYLFRILNKPQYSVCELLARNYANAVRILNATGSSSNMLLHLPCIMRHAGYDVTLFDYQKVRDAQPVPDIYAHSLTEGRDTFVLAEQAQAGLHHGMNSLYKALGDLGVAMDWAAPTITGKTWGARVAALPAAVSPALPEDRSVIRIRPLRAESGIDVLSGNFFTSSMIKLAGLSTATRQRFDGRVFVVRYYENEAECNKDMRASNLVDLLAAMPELTPDLLAAIAGRNGGDPAAATSREMILSGSLAFAFVIAGQGPLAFGMPEMFAPSQSLRHHGVIERSSLLLTDGRYSGVSKGACLGHTVPEAYTGGGIGALIDGDLLWVRFSEKRIDLIDRAALLDGRLEPLPGAPIGPRQELIAARRKRMDRRQLLIAASNVLETVTDAECGVVPLAVDRRATLSLPR